MRVELPKKLDILIMDDDVFFNDLLAKKLLNFIQKPEISERYSVSVEQYYRPEECLSRAKKTGAKSHASIAFVDYYLGDGLNGKHIIKLLMERNGQLKPILMSHSLAIIGNAGAQAEEDYSYNKILKHEFTPDICCILVENYMRYM